MKFLKVIFPFFLLVLLGSCLSEEGLEQYYGNRDEGIAFLEANKLRNEVTETETGLQYEVLIEGTGDNALGTDLVMVRYKMSNLAGTELFNTESSSVEDLFFKEVNNADFYGIYEGLQLMNEGAKYKFYIPYELAYRTAGSDAIEPYTMLILEMELVKTGNEDVDFLKENAFNEGVNVTASGLQYKIIEEGEGELALSTSYVEVNYEGSLIDGTVFDSTLAKGSNGEDVPISFLLSATITGFSEGIQLMKPGAKYILYIPYSLGYGSSVTSSIPAYSTLIFEVEYIK
jgi:FKBP-type peptidyl-prolyl cis-trans isomerase